ncbi:hypothetical protein HAINFHK1212_1851, partial [Haemophilus influenzae HK1212]
MVLFYSPPLSLQRKAKIISTNFDILQGLF